MLSGLCYAKLPALITVSGQRLVLALLELRIQFVVAKLGLGVRLPESSTATEPF